MNSDRSAASTEKTVNSKSNKDPKKIPIYLLRFLRSETLAMSEGIGVTEPRPELNKESVQLNSKRKPESPRSEDPRSVAKTPRLDPDQNPNPNPDDNRDASVGNGEKAGVVEEGGAGKVEREEEKVPEQEQSGGQCKDGLRDKGKGKMVVEDEEELKPNSRAYVDKGKGKMIVEEEESSDDDDDDDSDEEEAGVASGSESEYSDDPLMEVDLNNILPSRTRRWAPPVPGAYLVPEDQDEDDEDDDEDVSDVGGGDDDEDDDSESE